VPLITLPSIPFGILFIFGDPLPQPQDLFQLPTLFGGGFGGGNFSMAAMNDGLEFSFEHLDMGMNLLV
jgi:hypothetical protein